jgi:superfamily II DNA or RNA helicase
LDFVFYVRIVTPPLEVTAIVRIKNMETREYQTKAVAEVSQALQGLRSVMFVSPPGSGKSFMGAKIALSYPRVLWAAHRRELLDQATLALLRAGHVDFQCISVFVKPPAGRFDLLVMDETHHAPAPVLKRFVSKVDCDKILGLTATPFRLDKKFLDFEDTVVGATYDELVEAKFLMPIDLYSLRIMGSKHVALIDWLMAHPDKAAHSIVFVPSLDDARFFKTVLSMAYNAELVSGEQSNNERDNALKNFMNGSVDILVSCMVLTEGTDLPIAQTIVLGRETESLGLLTQMVGRGLRTFQNKTHCNVVEVVSVMGKQKQSIKAVVSPRKQYLVTRISGAWNTIPLA